MSVPKPVAAGASPGRPPAIREGEPLAFKGRQVSAGVGSFVHPVSPRASVADLWSTLEIAAAAGETALQRAAGTTLSDAAKARLHAYVHQARQYYEAVSSADPVAKPLLGYYFVLNAAKAFLTAKDETITAATGLRHGIGEDNSNLATPYNFYQEHFKIAKAGVFQSLAANTGRGYVWASAPMKVSRLIPYLPESVDLYTSSFGDPPALIPVKDIRVLATGTRPNREAWLTVEVSRLALEEAKLSPRKLLAGAAAFAASFDLVDGGRAETATYELRTPIAYAQMPAPLAGLRAAFDRALLVRNRALGVRRDSITISPHVNLASGEAITFAVMLHLSNMVRYRPHNVEELRGGGHWWLFTSWVDRACENFLLSISTRMSLEEHLIV